MPNIFRGATSPQSKINFKPEFEANEVDTEILFLFCNRYPFCKDYTSCFNVAIQEIENLNRELEVCKSSIVHLARECEELRFGK